MGNPARLPPSRSTIRSTIDGTPKRRARLPILRGNSSCSILLLRLDFAAWIRTGRSEYINGTCRIGDRKGQPTSSHSDRRTHCPRLSFTISNDGERNGCKGIQSRVLPATSNNLRARCSATKKRGLMQAWDHAFFAIHSCLINLATQFCTFKVSDTLSRRS